MDELCVRIFEHLDTDNNGSISTAELLQWVHDEQFLGNPAFVHKDAHDTVVRMKEDMDYNKDGTIDLNELKRFFNSVTDDNMKHLVMSLLNPAEAERLKLKDNTIVKIFNAIDTNNNGSAERGELVLTTPDKPNKLNNSIILLPSSSLLNYETLFSISSQFLSLS